jgi:hypothetical protein
MSGIWDIIHAAEEEARRLAAEKAAQNTKDAATGITPSTDHHTVVSSFKQGDYFDWNTPDTGLVGPISKLMVNEGDNKPVAFGPAALGLPAQIEGVVLLLGLKALAATPDGRHTIAQIAIKYLDTIGRILEEMSQSSSAHPITCCVNNHVATAIYRRLGLMSSHDVMVEQAWLDHQIGEAITTERLGQSLSAVTTIVRSTTVRDESGKYGPSESGTGLGAFAKILGKE